MPVDWLLCSNLGTSVWLCAVRFALIKVMVVPAGHEPANRMAPFRPKIDLSVIETVPLFRNDSSR